MTLLAPACIVAVIAWAVLVVVAHLLNRDQNPLSMGMSGLARGRAPWVMKSSFIVRGVAALLLAPALPAWIGAEGLALLGIFLLWLWGVGSVALALVDTDMPGEPPSRQGAAHALIALAAYVAGAAAAVVLSIVLFRNPYTAVLGHRALWVALAAAVALIAQFVGFGAAAREARSARESAAPGLDPGSPGDAPAAVPVAPAAVPAVLGAAVPPALSAATTGSAGAAGYRDAATTVSLRLAAYAGLLQRVFVGLLMAWTLLVALGV